MSRSGMPVGPDRTRRGAALLVALALIILAGALLGGTSAASSASLGTALRGERTVLADMECQRALGLLLSQWDTTADQMVVGGERTGVAAAAPLGNHGETSVTHTRIVRLSARLFLLSVATQVGPDDAVRARRRAALLVQVLPQPDSTAPRALPSLPAQWAQHRLY